MFCSQCGNVLNKNDRFCPKCGHLVRQEPEKISKQKKRSVDKKWIFTSIIVFIILVCAIIFSVYRWSKNGIYTNQKKSEISQFTDEDTRLPVDPDTYGKETPEEVFVEFIQAGCDADAERLMHTLPPDMLDNILAVPVGYEDYQRVLECFENYESDMWGLLSGE